MKLIKKRNSDEEDTMMSNIIFYNSYKLKKGVSIPDFLLAVENLNNEYISKQKGYVSFEILEDNETWADITTFETMEDAKRFAESNTPNEFAEKFYSFINCNSCRTHFYSIRKKYE